MELGRSTLISFTLHTSPASLLTAASPASLYTHLMQGDDETHMSVWGLGEVRQELEVHDMFTSPSKKRPVAADPAPEPPVFFGGDL
eukprot:m.37549 g.37549  ORF g.37549 m.37549 type:complete len:86 (+) comp5451_c0_seq2:1003-1260(+)